MEHMKQRIAFFGLLLSYYRPPSPRGRCVRRAARISLASRCLESFLKAQSTPLLRALALSICRM